MKDLFARLLPAWLEEFRPALRFLLIFLAVYAGMSLAYQGYLQRSGAQVDPMSRILGEHAALALRAVGYTALSEHSPGYQEERVLIDGIAKVKVIEGCNGLSVMILFLAFVLAFGPWSKRKGIFVAWGLVAIHAFNVIRVAVLALIIHHSDGSWYSVQKNLFTGSIYLLVLVLWIIWTRLGIIKPENEKAQ
jgi:exosortase family protein XrtF